MKLNRLTLKDQVLLTKFLGLARQELSVCAFENIYIWRGLFDIRWAVIEDNLCLFFQDNIGCFLYLPPLGERVSGAAVEESFRIMDKFNRNPDVSRLENAQEKELPFYQRLGYECRTKPGDYLCLRQDLAGLKGDKFKSQRASCNYFSKRYQSSYRPYSSSDKKECLRLYDEWMCRRKSRNTDRVYQGMLEDSRICLKILLENYRDLKAQARVVRIDNQIKGFSAGFKLNQDTYCILYEFTDLSIKGLSQFVFRSFCRELSEYKYINIMDDSGLENLKKVKLSYRPIKMIPAYIVTRKNA